MAKNTDFETVFNRLKAMLAPYADKLVLKFDGADEFFINTPFIMKNKKPLYFGSVKINKNYVSFHLMPVYVFPEILKGLSPELKKRMQGKSCFNFTANDESLFKELSLLCEEGYCSYQKAGYV